MPLEIDDLAALNPDALLADGLEDAYIGYTVNQHHKHVAVYDVDLCASVIARKDGMGFDSAWEYLEFNTLSAFVGDDGPIFVKVVK